MDLCCCNMIIYIFLTLQGCKRVCLNSADFVSAADENKSSVTTLSETTNSVTLWRSSKYISNVRQSSSTPVTVRICYVSLSDLCATRSNRSAFFSVDMVLAAGSSPLTLYLSSAPVPPSDTIKLALDIM